MKKFFFFPILFLFFSCTDGKKGEITFSRDEITAQNFKLCQDALCPEIEVDYLLAEGKPAISKNINKKLEEKRIKLLAMDPDRPSPSSFEKALENFIRDYQEFRADYPDFPAVYEFRISEEMRYRSNELIVIKSKHYLFTGGAHGYGAISFSSFSPKTGESLQPKDLFANLSAFEKYAEEKFRKKYEIAEGDSINSTGFFFENDTFLLPENLAVLDDEVVLIYNPYEVAAYARGKMELRFPKSEVAKWLKYK